MKYRRTNRGFTLIELLVVVAIIALLISILLPSLSRARETARTVKCAANQKQFGMANHMYADGFDNAFVPLSYMDPASGSWARWFQVSHFRSMLGVGDGFGNWNGSDYPEGLLCPNFPDEFADPAVMNHGRLYGWNRTTIRPGPGVAGFDDGGIIHRTAVKTPASTFALTDANDWNVLDSQANYHDIWDATHELNGIEGGFWGATMYRHNEGANFLHFDNHVAYFTKENAFPQDVGERSQLWYVYTEWWWE